MKKPACILTIKGIICDNPGCDYRDDSVEFKDYKAWLNKPCPKCGTNLLTKEDVRTIKRLIRYTKVINFLLNPFIKGNEPRVKYPIEMDGSGKIAFKEVMEYAEGEFEHE